MSILAEDTEHYGKASVLVGYQFQRQTYATPPTVEESRATFEEAKAEFDMMSSEAKQEPLGLELAAYIYRGLENWAELALTAAKLVRLFPHDPRWVIEWADGARRSESIEAAGDIIEKGAALHLDNAYLQLERARYAALSGNAREAQRLLSRATATGGAAISGKALREEDFQALLSGLPLEQKMAVLFHLPAA